MRKYLVLALLLLFCAVGLSAQNQPSPKPEEKVVAIGVANYQPNSNCGDLLLVKFDITNVAEVAEVVKCFSFEPTNLEKTTGVAHSNQYIFFKSAQGQIREGLVVSEEFVILLSQNKEMVRVWNWKEAFPLTDQALKIIHNRMQTACAKGARK